MNISIILSAGNGIRFGSDLPKQHHMLCGKEVVRYVYEALRQSVYTDKIIIVSSRKLSYEAEYVSGGRTHNESIGNAIQYIRNRYADCKNVLFADAARPFVTPKAADDLYTELEYADAVTTAQKITDSLGAYHTEFVDRSDYFLIQKPAAFRFEVLYRHFSAESETTAIIQQIPLHYTIKQYYGLRQNMKITYPEDLRIAELIMSVQ